MSPNRIACRPVTRMAPHNIIVPCSTDFDDRAIRRGHRRLERDGPMRFDADPNTGEPLSRNRRVVTADNTIHHSARYPSHIILPIGPLRRSRSEQ